MLSNTKKYKMLHNTKKYKMLHCVIYSDTIILVCYMMMMQECICVNQMR